MNLENSNLLDFFGIPNNMPRTLYNQSKKLVYFEGLTSTNISIPESLPPPDAVMQPIRAHVVNSIENTERNQKILLGFLVIIILVLLFVLGRTLYKGWQEKQKRKGFSAAAK